MLNSESYKDLGDVSASAGKRGQGKFHSVFITGKKRPGQDVGKMQVMSEVKENATDSDYLLHNVGEIKFIPYFIKRYWEKNVGGKDKNGKDFTKTVAFGWNKDVPKIDDACKFAYLIAGVVLVDGKALTHPKDNEKAEIKKGDPVLIYFKCAGMKFNGAMKLLDALEEKRKSLTPLSTNPEFEKEIVTPRRFICTATVTEAESAHGDKNVFEFVPTTALPEKAVEQVMNSAQTFKVDFEKQFDKTNSIKSSSSQGHSANTESTNDAVPFEAAEPAPESKPKTEENFDLGI